MPLTTSEIPNLNTITLSDGMDRTNYWRQAIKHLYRDNETVIPHGFYIPIEDIIELSKLATCYPEYNIVGVRAYFSFHQPQPDHPPYTDAVTGLLVPVHRVFEKKEGYNVAISVDRDLIIPTNTAEEDTVTIYDVTMPCPKVCDVDSYLY